MIVLVNICYFGPERIFNLRRDFILSLKYSLEDLRHTVNISHGQISSNAFNLFIGAYFLSADQIGNLASSGVNFATVNTEVIKNDLLNHNPKKTDFMGAYMPLMQKANFAVDVIWENVAECERRYGFKPNFLRWGYHPKLEDIEHKEKKDLDFYFFGSMSDRRKRIVQAIQEKGFKGISDGSCPYFLRNDRIARAKVNLNIVQDVRYTHVNSFRICYLANNKCAILSEIEDDGAGYLNLAVVSDKFRYVDAFADLISDGSWKHQAEESYEIFRQTSMVDCMEQVLDQGLGNSCR